MVKYCRDKAMPEYSYCCENCQHKWSIVCTMSAYKDKPECPSCEQEQKVFRDFNEDQIHTSVPLSLSDVKTLGHYADKQTQKYGKWKCEDMVRDFKTKKAEEGRELPAGMSRMEKPKDAPIWPGAAKQKRKPRRKKS